MLCPFSRARKYKAGPIGLPLAAALALGIYLGSKDTFDAYLPDAITDGMADMSDSMPSTGLDDAESYAEGDVT